MKRKMLKRLLVLAVSAAMVFGTCGASLAATVTEDTVSAEEADVSVAGTDEEEQEEQEEQIETEVTAAEEADEAAAASEGGAAAAEEAASAASTDLEQDDDGYYLITSGDDMDAFNEIVQSDTGADARLTQDITLNADYVPIGTASILTGSSTEPSYSYAGTFDGQGHTISGLSISGYYYYLGLFASVTSGCVIKDLTVGGYDDEGNPDSSVSGRGYVAGVAAYAMGSATFQNVTSNVDVTSTSTQGVGGILGYASGSGYTITILACENNGDITSSGNYVGGIAGRLYDSGTYTGTVAGCRNNGNVTGPSYVGGIVGYNQNYYGTVTGCANTGDIEATTYYVGGISGYERGTVEYCFNTGKITTGGTSKAYNGGIVGYLYGYSSSYLGTVDSCFNSGTFDTSTGYFGGIVGQSGSSSYKNQKITNCYNTADIGTSSIARAGGIVYYMHYGTYVTNCYNIGTITATAYAGAIVAYATSGTTLTNTSNNYALTGSASSLVGYGSLSSSYTNEFVDSDDLKGYAETLGDAYKTDSDGVNDGYPILTYQGLTVKEVKALMEDIDLDTSDTDDIGYAYAAYYCLSDEDQESVFGAAADTLTVTKTVSAKDTNGYALTSALASSISDISYTFTLYKADDENGTDAAAVSEVSYVLTDASGTETECETGSDGSFTLKDGETATFGGEYTATLGSAINMDTAGYYCVVESDAESDAAGNYETAWTQTTSVSGAEVADASGRTSAYVPVSGGSDNVEEVTFTCTNTYIQDVVSVTKTVSDQYVSSTLYDVLNDDAYTFTIYTIQDEEKSEAAGISYTVYEGGAAGSTFTTGDDGSFTLTGGQTAKFIGVDLDSAVTYSVEEAALTGSWTTAWTASSTVSDASIGTDGNSVTVTGSASTADTIDFTCTNTYLADSLTVTKTISDTSASGVALSDSMKSYLGNQSFSFTLYASGTAVANESYSVYEGETLVSTGNATGSDGTFTLSSGQTASFESLDMTGEVSYSVTENDLDESLWTTSWFAVSSASTEAVTSSTTSSGSVSLTGTASAADTIDFTCTNTYAYDSILIYTLDDLVAFSQTVSAGYFPDATVMADIDATGTATDGSSFEPIGGSLGNTTATDYPKAYTGTFEGNNHTIAVDMEQGTSTYFTGLFGGLGESGVIQNLTLKGTVSGGAYNGGIVAYATGGTIQNVTNEAAVSSTNGGRVGGIVGYSTSSALQITNCVNNGTVSATSLGCGGIFGQGYAVISGCTNNGAISSSSYSVAGIAGLLSGGSVTGSFNYGTVTGTYNVAGIVGNCSGTVQYCGNNGAVTTTNSSTGTSYAGGGVVGSLSASGASVDSCYNKAEVSGTVLSGGVAGRINGSSSYTTSVTNSYNTGSVSSSYGYAGGVAAYLYYKSELENCYNTGELSTTASTAYLGGVVSRMSTTTAPTAISNNYALDTADSAVAYYGTNVTEDMMTLVDSDTLKTYATATTDEDGYTTASVLGSAYKEDTTPINDGYPILIWEDAVSAEDAGLVLDYGLPVTLDLVGEELIAWDEDYVTSCTLTVSADEMDYKNEADGTYGQLTYEASDSSDSYVLTYTPESQLTGIDEFSYKLTVTLTNDLQLSAVGTLSVTPATSVYYEEDFGTDGITTVSSSDDNGMVIYSTALRTWTKAISGNGTGSYTQETGLAGDEADSVYGADTAYESDAYDSAGHAIYVGEDSDNLYYQSYGASMRYDFTGTGTTVYGRFLYDAALVKVQLYEYESEDAATATLVETKFLDTRNLASYYDVEALDADLYGTPLFDTALLDKSDEDGSLEYGSYMLRIYVYPKGTAVNGVTLEDGTVEEDESGSCFYLDGIRIDNPLGTDTGDSEDYEQAAEYYEADGESTASVVRIRDKVVDGEIDVSDGAFATLTDSDGDITDTSSYKSIGPKNELWLYTASGDDADDVDTVSFYILNWDTDADYKIYIGMRSPNPDNQATVTVGESSYSITSSTDMYYEITDTVTTTTYNDTTVGLVKISVSEGLLGLTRMKISGAEVSSESAVDAEGTLTDSAAASAMLYLVPTTVEWLSVEDFETGSDDSNSNDSNSDDSNNAASNNDALNDEEIATTDETTGGSDETVTDETTDGSGEMVTDGTTGGSGETVTDETTGGSDETVTDETTGGSDGTTVDDTAGSSDGTTGDETVTDETAGGSDASESDAGSTEGESEATAADTPVSADSSADSASAKASVAKVKAAYNGKSTKLTITVSAAVTSLKAGGKKATLSKTKANGQKVYTVKLKGDKRGKAVKLTLKTSGGSAKKLSVFIPKKLKAAAVRDASAKKTTITVKTSAEVKKLTVNGKKATRKKTKNGYVYTIKISKTKKNASYSIVAYNKKGTASVPVTVKK